MAMMDGQVQMLVNSAPAIEKKQPTGGKKRKLDTSAPTRYGTAVTTYGSYNTSVQPFYNTGLDWRQYYQQCPPQTMPQYAANSMQSPESGQQLYNWQTATAQPQSFNTAYTHQASTMAIPDTATIFCNTSYND